MTSEQALAKAKELWGPTVHLCHERWYPPTWGGNPETFWIHSDDGIIGASSHSWEQAFDDAAKKSIKQAELDLITQAYVQQVREAAK